MFGKLISGSSLHVSAIATQRVLWPALLVPSGSVLIVADVGDLADWWPAMPANTHTLFVALAVVSGVMTGVSRMMGPAAEAYRLGKLAGAREQRELCAATCETSRHGPVRLAATGTDPAMPAARSRRGPRRSAQPGTRGLSVIR